MTLCVEMENILKPATINMPSGYNLNWALMTKFSETSVPSNYCP